MNQHGPRGCLAGDEEPCAASQALGTRPRRRTLTSAGRHPIHHSLIAAGRGSGCSHNSEAMLRWWWELRSPIWGRQSIKMPLPGARNRRLLVAGQAGSCGLC